MRELVGGLVADDVDGTADRAVAEQRRLWPFDDFDAVHVEYRIHRIAGGSAPLEYAVDVHRDRGFVGESVLITGDAAHR